MSDYTPSVDEMRAAIKKSLHYLRGAYQIRTPAKRDESIREAYGTLRGFDRMIAQVQAETLREFAGVVREIAALGPQNSGLRTPDHLAEYVANYADRIEKEAGQ